MPISLSGTLTGATPQDFATVTALLPEHIRLSRAEPGCLSFDVAQTGDPTVWQVHESFRDRAAFESHQTRTRASAWFAGTAGLARAFEVIDSRAPLPPTEGAAGGKTL